MPLTRVFRNISGDDLQGAVVPRKNGAHPLASLYFKGPLGKLIGPFIWTMELLTKFNLLTKVEKQVVDVTVNGEHAVTVTPFKTRQ